MSQWRGHQVRRLYRFGSTVGLSCAVALSLGLPANAEPRAVILDQDVGAFSVAWSTGDRSLYVAGNTPAADGDVNIFVRRYSSDGRLIWQRLIATPEAEYARGIAADPGGGVVIAGWRATSQSEDALVAKFNARGTQQWVKTHDDWTGGDDRATAVAVDAKGRIWVAGRVPASTQGSSKVWWSRWTSAGRMAQEWTARSSIIGRSEAMGIAVTSDRVILSGSTFEVIDQQVGIRQDAWLGVFRTDGSGIWERAWGAKGGDDAARGVTVDRAGNVYVTGDAWAKSHTDAFARAYSSAGRIRWTKTLAREGNDSGRGVAVNPSGSRVVMAGTLGVDTFSSDILVRTFTAQGGLVWSRVISGSGMTPSSSTPDAGLAVAVTTSVYAVGRMAPDRVVPDLAQAWTARLRLDTGTAQWSRTYGPKE